MSSTDNKKGNWKEKITRELIEYWVDVIYLTLVFGAFAQYRRFLLATYDISYEEYGVSLIKAMIFAKIIVIGGVFRVSRALEHKPLIFPTLYKAVVFSLFSGAFTVIEQAVKNLWNGRELTGGLEDFFGKDMNEMLAGLLVLFVAFVPFFAFKELTRVLGEKNNIGALFFRSRGGQ